MQLIKLGIISLVAFALLITGISLFFPSHVRISRAVEIKAEKDSVWSLIKDPAGWNRWYPGADSMTPLVTDGKISGIGPDSTQGWMIDAVTDSSVTARAVGSSSHKRETGWNYFPGYKPGSFTIQWYMDFHLKWYPWEKFSSLLLDKRFGTMMEKGLDNLRKLAEKQQPAPPLP